MKSSILFFTFIVSMLISIVVVCSNGANVQNAQILTVQNEVGQTFEINTAFLVDGTTYSVGDNLNPLNDPKQNLKIISIK